MPFSRHEKAVLQFSGGKDSLACLHLMRPYWDRITVVWCNTGDAYPETLELMEEIRALVPHFVEARAEQPAQVAEFGFPVDVVTVAETPRARMFYNTPRGKVQPWFSCCNANLWQPLELATAKTGATLLIRGQRVNDDMLSPVRSGDVIDGREYYFPIEDWTEQNVLDYLDQNGIELPASYAWADTSLDCRTCTAFLDERKRELANLPDVHPEIWTEVRSRLETIWKGMSPDLAAMMDLLESEK